MAENDVIYDLKSDFEEFKRVHQEKQDKLAKNESVAELQQQIGRLNESLNDKSAELDTLRKSHQRKLEDREQQISDLRYDMDTRMNDLERLSVSQLSGENSLTRDVADRVNARQMVAWQHREKYNNVSENDVDVEMYRAYCNEVQDYWRYGKISNALSVGGDPSGGYFVNPDMSGRIVQLIYETSEIRPLASVQTIGTDRLVGTTDLGEVGYGWVGETQARPDTTTPTVGQWEIPVREAYAQPVTTEALLEDADINIETWLVNHVSRKLARVENQAFVTGDGQLKPRGFTTYPVTTADITASNWKNMTYVPSGHATNVLDSAAKFLDVIGKMKAPYLQRAVWAMRRETLSSVRQITQDNQFIFAPMADESPFGTIFGYPVRVFEDMPAQGTANNLMIAFADFGAAYQIVDRRGIRVLRDPYTAKPNVKFYSTMRVGGDVVDFDAIKFIRQSAT